MDYIRDTLLEVRKMAQGKDAPFLAYLIEMALIEVQDQISLSSRTRRPPAVGRS